MVTKVQIADIPILLKNVDFLKILTPIETQLIKPFLIKNKFTNLNKRGFLVNFKAYSNIRRRHNGYKASHTLIKKIKSFFPNTKDIRFKRDFFVFTKRLLSFYLLDNRQNYKRVNRLINSNYSRIVFNRHSFVIFDCKSKSTNIVYMPIVMRQRRSVLYRWPYHLNVMKLFFRALLSYQKDGILLHASSLEIGGLGLVFIGQGNSGKSTVVKLLRPDRTLSDETTVIRKINNTYKAFPNPWWNGYGIRNINIHNPQKPVRLKALFFIKKSKDKTSLRKLEFKEALSMLIYIDHSFQQCGLWDNKIGIKECYLFFYDLLKSIPAFQLNIKKGRKFKEDFLVLLNKHFKENG